MPTEELYESYGEEGATEVVSYTGDPIIINPLGYIPEITVPTDYSDSLMAQLGGGVRQIGYFGPSYYSLMGNRRYTYDDEYSAAAEAASDRRKFPVFSIGQDFKVAMYFTSPDGTSGFRVNPPPFNLSESGLPSEEDTETYLRGASSPPAGPKAICLKKEF